MIHNDYARHSGEEHACEAIASLLTSHGHNVNWYRRSSAEIAGSLAGRFKAAVTALHNPASAGAVRQIIEKQRPDVAFVQNLYPLVSPSVLVTLRNMRIPIVMRCPNYRLFCPNGLHFTGGAVCEKCLGFGREAWCVIRNCERSLPKSFGYALRNAVARWRQAILDNVDVFIVLSKFQRQRFIAGGIPEDKLAIVPNMIPATEGGRDDSLGETVSFLGRVAEEKGFADFAAAARCLPQIPFAVAGSVKESYRHDVEDLPPNLTMHGFLSGQALDAFLSRTRILVNCSVWYEGFPNTLTRAMAAGKPVITTRIGALPEIVTAGRTGLLYEPGNVAELVSGLQHLHAAPDRCIAMGKAGKAKADDEYGPERVYQCLSAACERARERADARASVEHRTA